jgi:hypothetical protein
LGVRNLAHGIEDYLSDHPAAAVLEDGRVLFDMRTARYSVSEKHGRCLLQLWSEERNLIRTVVELQERTHCLRLITRRMGTAKPQALEFIANQDRRTPSAREGARKNYQHVLERAITRSFVGFKADGLRSAMDLEHSFGPAYVRGRLLKGTAAEAVIGVSAAESGAVADGILTLGILWLDHCRQRGGGRRHFGGLKVIVPAGAWRTTAERMAWLNHSAAQFELFTLDERTQSQRRPVRALYPGRAYRGTHADRFSRHREPRFPSAARFLRNCRHRALYGGDCASDESRSGRCPGPSGSARRLCQRSGPLSPWAGICAGAAGVRTPVVRARG